MEPVTHYIAYLSPAGRTRQVASALEPCPVFNATGLLRNECERRCT